MQRQQRKRKVRKGIKPLCVLCARPNDCNKGTKLFGRADLCV